MGDKKSQAAMEFLMTYGWAILVVLVVIGALAYFGILSPATLLPEKCFLPIGLNCEQFIVTEKQAQLFLRNALGDKITVTSLKIINEEEEVCSSGIIDSKIAHGNTATLRANCPIPTGEVGDKSKFIIEIEYYKGKYSGLPHTIEGDLLVRLEKACPAPLPLNDKQDGVCAGSTKSCIAGIWQDDYSSVDHYEDPETSCSDGLDNDCDGDTDGADSDCPGGGPGPLDEAASEATATLDDMSDEELYPDWHKAKGGNDNIILKLISDVDYDIYLESFTLSWVGDDTNKFKHLQHLTELNTWDKEHIWDGPEQLGPIVGVFQDLGSREENLKIPANDYTIIDDLHFKNSVARPTDYTLVLNFDDGSSSTLSFTIS